MKVKKKCLKVEKRWRLLIGLIFKHALSCMYCELWFVWAMILKRHSLDSLFRLWIIGNATVRYIKHYPTRVTSIWRRKIGLLQKIWSKLRPTRTFPVEICFSPFVGKTREVSFSGGLFHLYDLHGNQNFLIISLYKMTYLLHIVRFWSSGFARFDHVTIQVHITFWFAVCLSSEHFNEVTMGTISAFRLIIALYST